VRPRVEGRPAAAVHLEDAVRLLVEGRPAVAVRLLVEGHPAVAVRLEDAVRLLVAVRPADAATGDPVYLVRLAWPALAVRLRGEAFEAVVPPRTAAAKEFEQYPARKGFLSVLSCRSPHGTPMRGVMFTTRQGRSGSVHGRRQPSQAALQCRLKLGCGANQFAGERPRGTC
jgi:hypothetical protein